MNTSSGNSDAMTRSPPIITLLSDFGLSDPYVASMKGVILSICRSAILVDITHEVPKFDVQQGAYLLAASVSFFPSGTIHLCVVDPGVGTERKALLVKTTRSYLVGPDNGVLMLAAKNEGLVKVIDIGNQGYMLDSISPTFHGRDLFSPVAAHLAKGVTMDEFGPRIEDYQQPSYSKTSLSGNTISGQIVHIDGYGNIVTNISLREIKQLGIIPGSTIKVVVGSTARKMDFCRTYGDAAIGRLLALIGSTGFLEVSVNRGNAALIVHAKTGTRVAISGC